MITKDVQCFIFSLLMYSFCVLDASNLDILKCQLQNAKSEASNTQTQLKHKIRELEDDVKRYRNLSPANSGTVAVCTGQVKQTTFCNSIVLVYFFILLSRSCVYGIPNNCSCFRSLQQATALQLSSNKSRTKKKTWKCRLLILNFAVKWRRLTRNWGTGWGIWSRCSYALGRSSNCWAVEAVLRARYYWRCWDRSIRTTSTFYLFTRFFSYWCLVL